MRTRTRGRLVASTMVVVALGMLSVVPAGAQDSAKVSGTISYLDRSVLPDNAEITVQLADVSRADAPAIVIAEQKFTSGGKQVPFPFELAYDPAKIDDRFTYAVQATITFDGKLLYRNTQAYLVITQGRPTNVDVVVSRIGDAAPQPTVSATAAPVAPTVTVGGGILFSGTVSLLERIALPDNAEILVQLVDVSRADAPATVITEQRFTSGGNQSPFPFDLIYNPALVDDKLNYALQATITIDGKLTYRNSDVYLVITQGRPSTADVIVRRVEGDGAQPTANAPITILPVTPTAAPAVAGGAAPTNTAPRTLPTTGSENNTPIMLALGALALLTGGVFVRSRRSRRS